MPISIELTASRFESCILLDSRDEAVSFPRHAIDLSFCEACGFVFNKAFDERLLDYSQATEESQHFSGTFNRFANELVAEIGSLYDLSGREVLEVGCGKGDFLLALCAKTGSHGVGIDPGFLPNRASPDGANGGVFRREYFTPENITEPPDFIVCRHTLEHIRPVAEFVDGIREIVGDRKDVDIFFETPDVRRVLAEGAFWDIYFEHCSYFTTGSHARLFRRAGMDVTKLYLAYDDQYIIQYASPSSDGASPLLESEEIWPDVRELASQFPARVGEIRDHWRDFVRTRHGLGRRVALWGGGSKAVAFLTTLGLGAEVAQVIDINPFKQGKFLPGAGHQVVAPEDVLSDPPDCVIAMNPIYLREIGASLEKMGLRPELVAV